MIDTVKLSTIIDSIPGDSTLISKTALIDIQRELVAGNAARAQLARSAAIDGVCAAIVGAADPIDLARAA